MMAAPVAASPACKPDRAFVYLHLPSAASATAQRMREDMFNGLSDHFGAMRPPHRLQPPQPQKTSGPQLSISGHQKFFSANHKSAAVAIQFEDGLTADTRRVSIFSCLDRDDDIHISEDLATKDAVQRVSLHSAWLSFLRYLAWSEATKGNCQQVANIKQVIQASLNGLQVSGPDAKRVAIIRSMYADHPLPASVAGHCRL